MLSSKDRGLCRCSAWLQFVVMVLTACKQYLRKRVHALVIVRNHVAGSSLHLDCAAMRDHCCALRMSMLVLKNGVVPAVQHMQCNVLLRCYVSSSTISFGSNAMDVDAPLGAIW